MANTIVNPNAGNVYYNVAGSAISAQPTVNAGTAKNLGANRPLLDNSALGRTNDTTYGSVVFSARRTGAIGGFLGSAVTPGAGIITSGGRCLIGDTGTAHGLSVNDTVIIYGHTPSTSGVSTVNGVGRVIAVPSTTGFQIEATYQAGTGLKYKKVDSTYTFATMNARRFVMIRGGAPTEYVAGVASTTLRSGAAQFSHARRSIKRLMNAFRHDGAALAVRSGYWNEYSGSWSTAPTATNTSIGNVAGSTVTDGSADNEASVGRSSTPKAGELVYKCSAPAPVQADYTGKAT